MRREFPRVVMVAAFKRADGRCNAERVRELFGYDPETGIFIYRIARSNRHAGSQAGARRRDGYTTLSIDGTRYYAHRIAWLYVTGHWPKNDIDHADGDRTNNRWSNLRDATRSQNIANTSRRSTNRSGIKGVFLNAQTRRWYSQITVNGLVHHLGHFDTREQAANAYRVAATHHFRSFAKYEAVDGSP